MQVLSITENQRISPVIVSLKEIIAAAEARKSYAETRSAGQRAFRRIYERRSRIIDN